MSDWNWVELRAAATITEDSAILAINKPANIAVMGERHDPDVVSLAADSGERLFPVHRIDKVTTGVTLFAKDLRHHGDLTRQFNKRSVDKRYLIITETVGLPPEGLIDLPLTTGRKGMVRIAAPRELIEWDDRHGRWWVAPDNQLSGKKVYPSLTRFATVWSDSAASLLVVEPVTGRRHQLRVHFAWIGHPIFGDPLFDKADRGSGWQTCLHSWRLGFDAAWLGQTRLEIEAPPPPSFWRPLGKRLPGRVRVDILHKARECRLGGVGSTTNPEVRTKAKHSAQGRLRPL